MSAISDYLENALLNHVLRNQSFTAPAVVYVALFTTPTNDDGSGTEVSGGGYARQPITFSAPSNGSTSNDTDVLFPVTTAPWGTITHAALFDAPTGGNMLFHGALTTAKTIDAGDQFVFKAGNFTVTIA